jgi:hypothetical protein
VTIYLLSLAELTGIDLQDQIETKMAKKAARVYHRSPSPHKPLLGLTSVVSSHHLHHRALSPRPRTPVLSAGNIACHIREVLKPEPLTS